MAARFHRQDPSKVRTSGLFIELSPVHRQGIERMSRESNQTLSGIMRGLLDAELRRTGILPRLMVPADFAAGEDAYLYPWSKIGAGHLPPKKMVWFSRQEGVTHTWENLFREMEHHTAEKLADICDRYGVCKRYAQRQFARYDRWRRGAEVYPQLDTLGAIRRAQAQRKGQKRR